MKHISVLFASTTLLCPAATSQSPSGDQLLAYVSAKTSSVVRQDMDGGCKAPVKIALKTGMPMDTALGGFTVCTQWVVVCPAGAGAGITNAVQFKPRG